MGAIIVVPFLSRYPHFGANFWEDWERPKLDFHWKPGRSAMELAKSWFREERPSPPSEFTALLVSEPRLQELKLLRGTPELVTALPERGEGRNHDLALVGKTPRESVTICIEAKADEPFGNETVREYWGGAIRRRNLGESTRVPERIQTLYPNGTDCVFIMSSGPFTWAGKARIGRRRGVCW